MTSPTASDSLVTVPSTGMGTDKTPWYFTSTFWKRFSVFLSIALSVTGLIISAVASLKKQNTDQLKALTVAGIVINGVSIAISALTSLDWRSEKGIEKKFAQQLMDIAHVHEWDGQQVVVGVSKRIV